MEKIIFVLATVTVIAMCVTGALWVAVKVKNRKS